MRRKRAFTCKNCGNGFESVGKYAKFCGKYCANQYKMTHGNEERETAHHAIQCPHNEGVVCYTKQCYCWKCGWNPVVDQRRKDKLQRKGCAV